MDQKIQEKEQIQVQKKNKKIKKNKRKFFQKAPKIDEELDTKDFDASLMDLEKNVLENPNNSEYWIMYLSYIAENENKTEFRKEIEKALYKINSECQQDVLNLWKCYLNFEFEFGKEDLFVSIFKRALNANKRANIIDHVVNLYIQKKNFEQAYEIVKLYLKKPENKIQSWLKQIEFLLNWKNNEVENLDENDKENKEKEFDEKIKFNIKRSLQSLDKVNHIKFLCQYSVLEYKYGNFQVARMNLENIITNFPKKTNVWNLYLDMEIKYTKNQQYIRHLFNKVCSLPLKLNQAKGFFKKYLNYEENFGDKNSQNIVKKKAEEFVRNFNN